MPRILIVEDEPTVRALLCDILASSYECVAVKTAEEGLRLMSESAFDAVITDVKLPGMGGEEFLKALLTRARGLPVIVISGGYGGDESKFLDAGAFAYLLKPFRFDEVEEVVARALKDSK
jgi:DNA-binding NtrC family response regulator